MGEAKRRKAILGDKYWKPTTPQKQNQQKPQPSAFVDALDGQPYLRQNPMWETLQEIWKKSCDKGFAIEGRGALMRTVAQGFGKSFYLPLSKITDPVGRHMVSNYNPSCSYVVAEPNEKGGTRWQIFEK